MESLPDTRVLNGIFGEYTITESYAERLTNRRELFRETTKTKKALHLVLVTTYGIKRNAYSNVAQNEVTAEDLFM